MNMITAESQAIVNDWAPPNVQTRPIVNMIKQPQSPMDNYQTINTGPMILARATSVVTDTNTEQQLWSSRYVTLKSGIY
jgi:hypothetical protein